MLGFREYRNKIIEVAGVTPEDVIKKAKIDDFIDKINKEVDAWVADLKKSIINPFTPLSQQRGMWDRFKNSVSNLWHGRYNKNNPYFWQNKLGDDLGREESFNHRDLSLEEYKGLREIVDFLETEILEADGTENLRISRLIDSKAQELKQKLTNLLINYKDFIPTEKDPEAPESIGTKEPPEVPETKPTETPSMPTSKSKKPPHGTEELVMVAQKLLNANVITKIDFDRLELGLNNGDRKAQDEVIDKWNNYSKKPEDKKEEPVAQTAPENIDPTEFRYDIPPTKGKKWSELDPDEKEAWNKYGGGLQKEKIDGCLNDYGIIRLPWVLRIGDPRHQILVDQGEGKLVGAGGRCKKRHSPKKNDLLRQGRLEDAYEHPIKTKEELEAKVKEIEEKIKAEKETRLLKRGTPKTAIDSAREKESEILPTKEPEATPKMDTFPKEAEKKVSDLNRVADINPEEIKNLKPSHTNALSPTAHRGERTTDLPSTKRKVNSKKFANMLVDLYDELDRIQDETVKEKFKDLIKNLPPMDEEELKKIQNRIKRQIEAENGTLEMDWTINDTKELYKKKLQEKILN